MVQKKRAKTPFNHPVAPQHDTEITGISNMDSKEADIELQARKYAGIEKKVNPSLFYDLTGTLKNDAFGKKKKTFDVSQFHGVNNEMFSSAGFIECSTSDMVRGQVGLGAIALSSMGGVAPKTVENTIDKIVTMSDRVQRNALHLDGLLNIVLPPGDTRSVSFLRKLVSKHGKNQYGAQILQKLMVITGKIQEPPKYLKTKGIVSKACLDRCEALTKDTLTDKIYVIDKEAKDKGADNYKLNLYISRRIWGLLTDYKRVYFASGVMATMVRAAFVTGQYIIAKSVLSGKLSKDEMAFYIICQEIAKYGRDKY
jgi:hypothetical protein